MISILLIGFGVLLAFASSLLVVYAKTGEQESLGSIAVIAMTTISLKPH